jgi:hypothetical protein
MEITKTETSDAKKLIQNDPVRPEISAARRTSDHFEMYHTGDPHTEGECQAVICIAFCKRVPINVEELLKSEPGTTAVFYSVWSYQNAPRAGQKIVFEAIDLAKSRDMTRFVTMSPKTLMATRFHTANGAKLLAENPETNNFEYNPN